jgi:hypothetical protein
MTAELQQWWALVVVGLAVALLVLRAWRGRRKPGCGGGCGCQSQAWRRR